MRPKRSMSNFDIAILLKEIRQSVVGSRIDNIYQIKEVFLFKLSTDSGEKVLLIEPGFRIHLTSYRMTMPKTPTNFCSALRKHIRNGRIENLAQYDLDRIANLTIGVHSRKLSLVVELFREGNLILCDPENRIILARHYKVMRDRSIKPKEFLISPPLRGIDLMNLSENELTSILDSSSAGLIETLASRLNLDPLYAEEICAISNIEKDRKAKGLSRAESTRILEAIRLTVSRLNGGPYSPRIVYDVSGEALATAPFHLRVFENMKTKEKESYNDVIDEFFSSAQAETSRGLEAKATAEKMKGIQITIEEQRSRINEFEKLEIDNRRFGDLIFSNLPEVEEILSVVRSARKRGIAWSDIEEKLKEAKKEKTTLINRISSLDPRNGTITLTLNGEEIKMNMRLSATENASRFYELAKRGGAKKKGAESALQNALEKLKELKLEEAPTKETALKKKRVKKWYESYRWFISSDGFLAIGGRDSKTNEIIVKKRMETADIFVHADIHGAPVVVIKSEGRVVPESTLTEACQFSVSYSRFWKLGTEAGDAYWVKGEQVSLSPPSGEYLQKGSFIVRGERTYLKGIPLRISVGIVIDEEGRAFPVAGPPSSIMKKTRIKVDLMPGEETGSRLAHLVKDKLVELTVTPELRQESEEMTLDEFLLLLPTGGSRVIK